MKKKECPACAMQIDDKAKECPICGHEFTQPNLAIKAVAVLLILLFLYFMIF